MIELVCPACGARAAFDEEAPSRGALCPRCGGALPAPPAGPRAIIDVSAEPIAGGEAPTRRAEPVDGGAGPRMRSQSYRTPFGEVRTFTMHWSGAPARSAGPGCCGIGCMALLALMIATFIRGCASWF